MEKWFIRNNNIDYKKISKDLKINEFLGKLLINRGIVERNSIEIFLDPNLNRLYPTNLMKDLPLAANIIIKKIKEGKRIRIVGDFDVDGIMSVYILYRGLKRLGANIDYAIPDRILDGYGINKDIIKSSMEDGIDTILTCDNGISAIDEVNYAKELGLTIIVTDHHDIGESLPNADAIINPKQYDCNYPFKSLCGAGISFKLVQHLYKLYDLDNEIFDFLEYVSIATVCDVVDLIDENRIIVKNGLEKLKNTNNIGLRALIEVCDIKDKQIGVYHIGFIIGPTINASGRLDSALLALKLLLTEDEELAKELAKTLKQLNEERKAMTIEGVDMVIHKIENTPLKDDMVLIIYEPKIHESIAGIIAGRIKDMYNKPTIVLTNGKDGPKGSGRSIEEYNMYEELSKCKELLNRFGGHPMAAGLSMDKNNIERLRKKLNDNILLSTEDLIPKIYIDMELPIEYISYKLINEVNILEPFGKGNSRPIFGGKGLRVIRGQILGVNKNVIKLNLLSPKGKAIDGLIFNNTDSFIDGLVGKYGEEEKENMYKGIGNNILIDILYYPNINEYQGNTTLQVVINNYRFN